MADVAKELYKELKPNDIVIGLGAGTITKLGSELLNLYNEINV
jgi:UDP-N-acetylmuramate-alanine ligase